MKQFTVLLFVFVLTSCASSGSAIQTGIAKTQIALPTATSIPTQTLVPTRTHLSTRTPSFTPTATITLTPIPTDSILFQRNFENDAIGEWSYKAGAWTVEQEQDGNHCLCGSGLATNPPQIWYNEKASWTDYILETRVKFIKGQTLFILMRSKAGSDDGYGVVFNGNFNFMQTWYQIGGIIPILPYPGEWYTIRAAIKGDSFNARVESSFLESSLSQEITLKPPIIDHGGFGYVIGNGDEVCFDDIKVWSLK